MPYIASMGIYVFSKQAMLQLLRDTFPDANDFGSEVIPGATNVGMRVFLNLFFLEFDLYELQSKQLYHLQVVPMFNYLHCPLIQFACTSQFLYTYYNFYKLNFEISGPGIPI